MHRTSPTAGVPAPGATFDGGRTTFRLWAPDAHDVQLLIDGRDPLTVPLATSGYRELTIEAPPGTRYRYRLDDGDPQADLASRYQPDGPHGASEVIDAAAFDWTDEAWLGIGRKGLVVYEMHVGTFTTEGTWRAAAERLPDLAELGITVIEMMPIADFPGAFGWGYDGVLFFAPAHQYGRPDDLRAFVDRAHSLGIGVVLDVVYNHAGPDGNWFRHYAADYFGQMSEWGHGFNFDGRNAAFVRAFFEANAAYWVREFHVDGLRLDATQQIFDTSTPHILQTVADAARDAAGGRSIWIVAENEPQHAALLRPPAEGGHGLDALWNDDFHHAAIVAATGHREAYYSDYQGSAQELVSCATRGFLYQGQRSRWQGTPRGTHAGGILPERFVAFLQNHDQIANSLDGRRLHALTSPALHRALVALTLLGPWTPMLFQGDEFAASSPFLYFADHHGELAARVARGRLEFLGQFPSIREATRTVPLVAPHAASTFAACRLNHGERASNAATWRLYRDLIALRRCDRAFAAQEPVAGAVLGPHAFVLRTFAPRSASHVTPSADAGDRLLVVNLDRAPLTIESLAEPLLAPQHAPWSLIFSSDAPVYGGSSQPFVFDDAWVIPPESATVLA